MPAVFIVAVVVAYLVGAVPFGVLIAKMHGKDLRSIGSGNIGATNVARACGRKWGYICFGLDVVKGLAPVATFPLVTPRSEAAPASAGFFAMWLAVGIAAIIGHIFPLYLRFKGGKGVSTSFGVALGLWPYFTVCGLVALLVWIACVLKWRYISFASICAALTFPVTLALATTIVPAWDFGRTWPLLVVAVAIPVLVIVRHRENITRLRAGTESKIRTKGRDA
ncbi:MAG: glycerol-3-phosphate 1-O-acyltransferase PlsY [Sedimentisphaerales bacterium]|nr:glycerol-3-phosphate 1-O-acyltransferase PlsY [Sedimentisphaerales bacterium]